MNSFFDEYNEYPTILSGTVFTFAPLYDTDVLIINLETPMSLITEGG